MNWNSGLDLNLGREGVGGFEHCVYPCFFCFRKHGKWFRAVCDLLGVFFLFVFEFAIRTSLASRWQYKKSLTSYSQRVGWKLRKQKSWQKKSGAPFIRARRNWTSPRYRRSPRYTVPLIRGFGDTRFSKFDNSLSKLYWFDTSIINCQIISVLIEC